MRINSLKVITIIFLVVVNIYLVTADISCLDGNCEVGCCVDQDGFQHNKYPRGICLEKDGNFNSGFCNNMPTCKFT